MISIIIPTYNAAKDLETLLSKLLSQTQKDIEIIIIDSSSKDCTLEIAQSYDCRTISIHKEDFDHGTTRNLAASKTLGEFLVFLTQDAIPADEQMLTELIRPLQANPNIAVCFGRQLPRTNAGALESFAREYNYPDQSILKGEKDIKILGIKTFFCSNSCAAYRRSIFEKLGGFKNNVIANEDMLFAAKAIMAGYSTYYAAGAQVYHSHAYSLPQTFKRYFNIGRFFADNQNVFADTGLGGYGTSMLKTGIKRLYRLGKIHYIIPMLIESSTKAVACKIGSYYQRWLAAKKM